MGNVPLSPAVLPASMPPVKSLTLILFASALVLGCQNESKLDGSGGGNLEARVKKLEEQNAKYAEALDFLQKVYDQQKQQERAQREQREREELAPDGTWAVDVSQDVKGGQVEGPNTACVTLVEAWDFA